MPYLSVERKIAREPESFYQRFVGAGEPLDDDSREYVFVARR